MQAPSLITASTVRASASQVSQSFFRRNAKLFTASTVLTLTGSLALASALTIAGAPAYSLESPAGLLRDAMPQTTPPAAQKPALVPLMKPSVKPFAKTASRALPDGTYVYGESALPNQIGATYLVMEVRDRQVMGAFYEPSSSFDCFQGKFQGNQLALNVLNSYEPISHPYTVAVRSTAKVASSQSSSTPVELAGYHRLQTVSDRDRQVLSACQARFSATNLYRH